MRKHCMRIVQQNMIYLELTSSAKDDLALRLAMAYKIHTLLTLLLFTTILNNFSPISIPSNLCITMRLNIKVRQFQYCALWASIDCNRKLNFQIFLPCRRSKAKNCMLIADFFWFKWGTCKYNPNYHFAHFPGF